MASVDLHTELQKEQARLDSDTEKRLCAVILERMNDAAGEISELAIKCLSVLVPKIQDSNLSGIVVKLIGNVLTGSKESDSRESGNVGLKAIINSIDMNSTGAKLLVNILTPELIKGINSKNDDVVMMVVDTTREFIAKFGSLLDSSKTSEILKGLLYQLSKGRAAVRKKTISCIGALSVYLAMEQLDELCGSLISTLHDSSVGIAAITSTVQAVGTICASVNYRMSKHIDSAIARIMELATVASEEDIDLIESCIRALESFISKCPMKTNSSLDALIDITMKFLVFDPNYSDDLDTSDQDEMITEDDEGDMYSDEEAYSDDEDDSWKVRKASASCLVAVIVSNLEQIFDIYKRVGSTLISRFGEREENVRTDILQTYIIFLRFIRVNVAGYGQSMVLNILKNDVTTLLKQVDRRLKEKSLKTRLKIFQLLKEMALVYPEQIAQHAEELVTPITKALIDGSSMSYDLKLEVLSFLQVLLKESTESDFHSVLPKISPMIFNSVNERYYKVSSASLQVCMVMVHIIRPSPDTIIDDEFCPIIQELFIAVMKRLKVQDIDQEVKDCSIRCIGDAVAVLGDFASDHVEIILQVLLERLRSESTRLTTVKALTVIGASSLELNLNPFISPAVEEFTLFLKKANMSLKQASLCALEVFCGRPNAALTQEVIEKIITDASGLVNDTDLHLASHSLDLLATLARKWSVAKSQMNTLIVPKALELVHSPLLQGTALNSLKSFFASLMPECYDFLFKSLISEVPGKVQQLNIAKCVATISCEIEMSALHHSSLKPLMQLTQSGQSDIFRKLALLCLGEIGRYNDLNQYPEVENILIASLNDTSEEVKTAASYAFGVMTLGNLTKFLPELLSRIQTNRANSKLLYRLLQALNEVLSSLAKTHSTDSPLTQDQVLNIRALILSGNDFEEDARNIAAECLGQVSLLHPDLVLPELKQEVAKLSENVQYIIITAIKHAVVDQPHNVDQELKPSIHVYLECLMDPSRHVRKAAVQLLSTTLAHKYILIQDCLQGILPKLYAQSQLNEDLVRMLDFGPFRHKIDDGLELRKASFECMNLLLDYAFSKLDLHEFLKYLENGLADVEDIKLLCYPMLIKLSQKALPEVSSEIGKIVDLLYKPLSKNIPKDAAKHEIERHQAFVLSCLRVVDALSLIPGAISHQQFKRMYDFAMSDRGFKSVFQQVQKERLEAEKEQKLIQDRGSSLTMLSQGLYHSSST